MKFVTIGKDHINVDSIVGFCHDGFYLTIYTASTDLQLNFQDEDRQKYRELCSCFGVDMVEV